MDIWPRASDGRDMDTRRDALITALKVAGLAATAPLITAAAPYVRLDSERDTLRGERDRLAAEIESLYEQQGRADAGRLQAAVLAAWANLARLPQSRRVAVYDLKARAATIAGSNSITLADSVNGRQWFELAHRYARLSDDPSLISLAHARSANAAMYWRVDLREARADAGLARHYAATAEQRASAAGQECRIPALMADSQGALQAADEAIAFADSRGGSDRIDRCTIGGAHMTVSRALVQFPRLATVAEEHALEALRLLPKEAELLRAHALLDVAAARARLWDISGALDAAHRMVTQTERMEPVLRRCAATVAGMIEQRTGRPSEIRRYLEV